MENGSVKSSLKFKKIQNRSKVAKYLPLNESEALYLENGSEISLLCLQETSDMQKGFYDEIDWAFDVVAGKELIKGNRAPLEIAIDGGREHLKQITAGIFKLYRAALTSLEGHHKELIKNKFELTKIKRANE